MRPYDWRSPSANWFRRWRLAVNKAKEYQGTNLADTYEFAAVIANAGYVINNALESQKETDSK